MEFITPKTPLIIGFDGTQLNPDLENHLKQINPLGIILFKRNIVTLEQTGKLISDLQQLLGKVMIAVDHEGGIVNRFPEDCPVPPSPAALNACGQEEVIRKSCALQAELLAALGFNMNFVPLVDLALRSENQVIGTRAFSDNPEDVARYARICIEEHNKVNVGTTAKHFPTHGRSITDTHFDIGSVRHESAEQLEQDLLPYRKTIELGVSAVMTAHLSFPQLDDQYPASLSKSILDKLLVRQLGFKGLVISDCVEMEGISRGYDPATIIQLGMNAGVDLFISSFSLKRSKEYQLALAQAYRELIDENIQFRNRVEEKMNQFIGKYASETKVRPALPQLSEAIRIHKASLERTTGEAIPENSRGLCLVELSNREKQGINLGNDWNTVSSGILKHSSSVKESQLLYRCDQAQLSDIIERCNKKQLTCVLLTANGYRKEGYQAFIKSLKKADSAIHIALLDPDDLMEGSLHQWSTRGYNACTGIMLAETLDA